MSDKSFGDHMSRGLVKNPLLSTAVTGLSIEDLTHNAVLLPVSRTQELFGRQEPIGLQSDVLAEKVTPNIPSGDANFAPIHPNPSPEQQAFITQQNAKNSKNDENEWQAPAKIKDDFDVNEYFARLQGTRYVSAPINSHLKESTNASLEAKEENLEEINLNEPDKGSMLPDDVQQSLTADIAQNFSQLPTVLPQMASAVFSSFSNMLSMKSREHTPDEVRAYQERHVGVPLVGVSETKEVAPPLKEPPVCGPGNFRITTKKKAYAQIPGLSSGETVQTSDYTLPTNQTYFTPPTIQSYDDYPNNKSSNASVHQTNIDFNAISDTVQNIPVELSDRRPNMFEVPKEDVSKPLGTPQYNLQESLQAPIIPPPPMFSNLAKRDSMHNTGKAVLPPSVARRISTNKPTINTQAPTFSTFENIFVPAPIMDVHDNSPTFAPNLPPTTSQTSLPPILAQTNQSLPASSFNLSFASQELPTEPFIPKSSNTALSIPTVNISLTAGNSTPVTNASFISIPTANVEANKPLFTTGNILPPTNAPFIPPNVSSASDSSCKLSPPPTSDNQPLPPLPTFAPGKHPQLAQNVPFFLSANMSPSALESAPSVSSIPSLTRMPVTPAHSTQIFNPYLTTSEIKTEFLDTQNVAPRPAVTGTVPTMFNPLEHNTSILSPNYKGEPITSQMIPPAAEAQIPEPPKSSGNTNFRMTKKRPQYYSGPIEGIGAISNNVKPGITPVATTSFQGAMFTPETTTGYQSTIFTPENVVETQKVASTAFQSSLFTPEAIKEKHHTALPGTGCQGAMFTPEGTIERSYMAPANFNFTKQAEAETYTPFDINKAQAPTKCNPDYSTAFDMSRNRTDSYEPPKQESAFGIIGSLKSKLSSIDINKIQSSVTTFFDPEYNAAKLEEHNIREREVPACSQSYDGIEIFVPNVETTLVQPCSYDNYQSNFTYGQGLSSNPSDYYQQQVHNVYSPESFYSEPQYGTHTYKQDFQRQKSYSETPYSTLAASGYTNNSQENAANTVSVESPLTGYVKNNLLCNKDDNTFVSYQEYEMPRTADPVMDMQPSKGQIEPQQNVPEDLKCEDVKKIEHGLENMQIQNENHTNMKQINLAKEHDTLEKNIVQKIDPIDYMTSPFVNESGELNADIAFCGVPRKESHLNYFDVLANADKEIEDLARKEGILSSNSYSKPLYNPSSMLGAHLVSDGVSELGDEVSWNSNEEEFDDQSIAANLIALADFGDEDSFLDDNRESSELKMCETCREVTKPEAKEADLTSQLIENITSPIQLLNPVEVPLTESHSSLPVDFDGINQYAAISLIADETVETLQVQSASELLDDSDSTKIERNYGWRTESAFPPGQDLLDHDYTFNPNPNEIEFFGNNNLFFDNIPNNASDEIKAEFQVTQDEAPVVAIKRQMSIPTAPPAEESDDAKSDETGVLDVQLIEQDASNDFPVFEEFVIEPSETDDGKLEFKDKSDEVKDTFTNRVDRFKKLESSDDLTEHKDFNFVNSCTKMPSYLDTGNYAAETHYKNSLTSPTSTVKSSDSNIPFRIPPGFEDPSELISQGDENVEPKIPETSTQTRVTATLTFSEVQTRNVTTTVQSKLITVTHEMNPEAKLPASVSVFGANIITDEISSSMLSALNTKEIVPSFLVSKDKQEEIGNEGQEKKIESLPDPINFFASRTEKTDTSDGENRLASYFASPAKTDTTKSFFELSQGQDHYRQDDKNLKKGDDKTNTKPFFELSQSQDHYKEDANIAHNKYVANLSLIKDLTSFQNIEPNKDQVFRTVNYFTVEYDDVSLNKGEPSIKEFNEKMDLNAIKEKNEIEETLLDNDEKLTQIVDKCKHCRDFKTGSVLTMFKTDFDSLGKFKFRQAMDGNSGNPKEVVNTQQETRGERSITLKMEDVVPDGDNNDGVAILTENRTSAEYEPVKYHWFYRVDLEGKSTWRGFSTNDSRDLENAFHSPVLSENTLVPTDGGRFDVNVVGRLRLAVYWTDKPTNVRRCSWFYKGTTDARYVPYTEPVAEKLEEEYRHGVTTGEWHRRLVLPNQELVVMHGPAVMVHFLQAGAADAFSAPNIFTFGKRVYRNPPKFKVARDEPSQIDHLLLLVHGAGEWRTQKEKIQSTMRPRVVRRGFEESEIEDSEPSSIDHLLLLCHGVGSACDMRFRSVEEVVDDFRATSLQLLQSHYRESCDSGVVGRVEVLPISWHASLHAGPGGVDRRLARVTLASIPRLRTFTNDTVLDVLFYTSPHYCQMILDTVCGELNRVYSLFRARNPNFKGGVSLGGHSLGSVILYDLLCNQESPAPAGRMTKPEKQYLSGTAANNPMMKYPKLDFEPLSFYALGSPIAIFECIRGVESLGTDFYLPTCRNFFNIFHPYDPIAYRLEPLVNSQLQSVKPSLIPHHKGRKRMHLELKETMARVGADLKQKLVESIRSTWSSMWAASAPPPDHQLEKVVEEEIEKEELEEETPKEEVVQPDVPAGAALGKLNGGRRVDFVLQEAPFEMINEYLFAMSSHVCYWESEDTMLLMLREIYDSLGVGADVTVPQPNLTVQRMGRNDETFVVNRTEDPSTSQAAS